MSPEAWDEFWRVTFELLGDWLRFGVPAAWLGWHLRGRHERKRERTP